MASAEDVLNVARGQIGYSRWTDPEPGTVYGRWFATVAGDSYYGESGVPYCAMFVSWCFAQAGASFPAYPSAYCPDIVNAAYAEGRTPYNEDAEPGDLVLFDWGGDGVADHVGIVESNHPEGGYMTTIEGNTSSGDAGSQSNGGGVYRRERPYSSIRCICRPYYDGETSSADNGDGESSGGLEVDGWWGSATTERLQEFFGTQIDGVVSGQCSADSWRHAGCPSFEYGEGGSMLIAAIQQRLNENGYQLEVDRLFGENSINALVEYFSPTSGCSPDGTISGPSATVMAMQAALNEGRF